MNLYLVLATRIDKDGPWYTYVALPTFWVQSGCDEDAEKRAKMILFKGEYNISVIHQRQPIA